MRTLKRHMGWLVKFPAMVAAILLVLAHAGRTWWVLDLLTNYWPQLAGVLLVSALLLVWADRRRWAMVTGGLAIYALLWVWPFVLPYSAPMVQGGRPSVSLLLTNVYSFRDDLDDVMAMVIDKQPDIVVLLEAVPGHYAQVESLERFYPYSFHEPRLTGQAVFSRIPVVGWELKHWPGGRIDVMARLDLDGRPLMLLATHGRAAVTARKAAQRNLHLDAMGSFIGREAGPVVVAGDLNTTPFSSYYAAFRRAGGLVETRRGVGLMGTWPTAHFFGLPAVFNLMAVPLDHILVTTEVAVYHYEIAPPLHSDHQALWIEFALQE